MDPRLLRLYNEELSFVRDMGAEFAAAYPKIAGRLGIDSIEVADPYVERLLEGFAFMAARVQLKLDAQFPVFTQHLLELVYPHYLSPTPSMAIAKFMPDPEGAKLETGYTIPRDTVLTSMLSKDGVTSCEFRTSQDVQLWPITISEADYFSTASQVTALGVPDQKNARAALRIRLKTTNGAPFSALSLKSLSLFLQGSGDVPSSILEQLLADCLGVVARPLSRPLPWQETLQPTVIEQTGLGDDEALLPIGPRSFQGYRVLQEYFAFPERSFFVRVNGLARAVSRSTQPDLELIFLLRRSDRRLERSLTIANFVLFATPAINLFPRRADRIHLTDKVFEHHVVADRTRALDLEIYSVLDVVGEGEGDTPPVNFRPFYSATDLNHPDDSAAYFTARRELRMLSARSRQSGPRTSYIGSEIFLQLVDRHAAPYQSRLRQLSIRCLCTNRDLPLMMPTGRADTDFTLEIAAPITGVRCLAGPTRPRPSRAHGDISWRLISHLSLNYLSLVDAADGGGAEALRELLSLYGDMTEPVTAKQIDGIKSVASNSIVRRLPGGGQAAIARGVEIAVTLDESAFEGIGAFPLGIVLNHFFSKYVSINSFTETVIRTLDRGEVMRWPMMIGRRQIS